MTQRTPLYDQHLASGGRVVDFAGWEMPVQYTGILDEHKAVRETCGVFDISHMGEFFVQGTGATAWLDGLLTNRVAKLQPGEAQYSLMLNEAGGVIDDLIVYRLDSEEYLLIVNAAKIDEDEGWMRAHLVDGIAFDNASSRFAAVAVQGPDSARIFQEIFAQPLPVERNRVLRLGQTFVVTTGYTGEAGFELVVPVSEVVEVWGKLLAAGVKPCGLGARDTLRLEMCYPLNGSDLSPERTPIEAGLGFFVDLEKSAFIGREVLLKQKAEGVQQRLAAIQVLDKAPPIRSHYPVWANGEVVGETTSGALSPSLNFGIAMAYLPISLAKQGQPLEIEIRGRKYAAQVVRKPFYQKNS